MTKKIKNICLIIFIIVIFLYILINVIDIEKLIKKQMYPLAHQEYVEKYAAKYNVNKYLIYAIIKTESNFNKDAISSQEARGLMQIMETTANEVAQKIDYNLESVDDLNNPETNIMIGTKYFSNLLDSFNQNEMLAIAAYNAGIGNVKKWISDGIINEDGSNLENIPYKETNNYVRKVLRDKKIYKELYGN